MTPIVIIKDEASEQAAPSGLEAFIEENRRELDRLFPFHGDEYAEDYNGTAISTFIARSLRECAKKTVEALLNGYIDPSPYPTLNQRANDWLGNTKLS